MKLNNFIYHNYGKHQAVRWVLAHMADDKAFAPFVTDRVQIAVCQLRWRARVTGIRIQGEESYLLLENGEEFSCMKTLLELVSGFEVKTLSEFPVVEPSEELPPITGNVDFLHVDDFIDNPANFAYARFMLNHFRWAAALRFDWDLMLADQKLFAVYQGKLWRVTGASRMGDIWLHSDFSVNTGYQERINIAEVTQWRQTP